MHRRFDATRARFSALLRGDLGTEWAPKREERKPKARWIYEKKAPPAVSSLNQVYGRLREIAGFKLGLAA